MDMSVTEALEVVRAIESDDFPPTNPAVLLRAGYTVYMAHFYEGFPPIRSQVKDLATITMWLDYLSQERVREIKNDNAVGP